MPARAREPKFRVLDIVMIPGVVVDRIDLMVHAVRGYGDGSYRYTVGPLVEVSYKENLADIFDEAELHQAGRRVNVADLALLGPFKVHTSP